MPFEQASFDKNVARTNVIGIIAIRENVFSVTIAA
jgi:hypothetical protein